MQQVEVGFKVKQNQEECERILKNNGYELMFNTETHDLYFTNKKLSRRMTEQEINFHVLGFDIQKVDVVLTTLSCLMIKKSLDLGVD